MDAVSRQTPHQHLLTLVVHSLISASFSRQSTVVSTRNTPILWYKSPTHYRSALPWFLPTFCKTRPWKYPQGSTWRITSKRAGFIRAQGLSKLSRFMLHHRPCQTGLPDPETTILVAGQSSPDSASSSSSILNDISGAVKRSSLIVM
jgi:hypothetical protein